MEVIEVSNKIEETINKIQKTLLEIKERAENRARSLAEYENAIAITILKLKNGKINKYQGEDISSLPATLIEKTARGMCMEQCFTKDKAEAEYKNVCMGLQALQAILNGYQSINRHLDTR